MPYRRSLLVLLVLVPAVLTGCARRPAVEAPPPPARVEANVLYEVFVRDFTPEGTFRAMIPRLDTVRAMGVNTIWLMPIHPVGVERRKGELGSPYAIQDYFAVNPRFGTEDDFRALVDAAHERGLRVLIDLVANHTAWDNAWVTEHPDWYTKDSTGAITHPPGTDWTDVADLDYSNPAVWEAMREAMRYWVEEFDIDGYRCDVAELVPLDFWAEAIAELRQIKPVLMLAEGADPALYDVGFDLTYAWDTYAALKEVWDGLPTGQLYEALEAEREAYDPADARLRFTTNHDETAWDAPPVVLFDGLDGARAASVVAITLPGVPLLYNGQEVGSEQRLPLFEQMAIEWDQNPEMRRFYDALLALRAESPALQYGALEPIDTAGPDVIAYYRMEAGEEALVLVNARDRAVEATLPDGAAVPLGPYGWRVVTGARQLSSEEFQ
ncbi:MAG: alpha-amylase family glycosyl hydrolase [Rhodothermales bacterium]|nr:alpha-amylase family glycosyl hydrolase [Rhodothermales bacterium]